MSRRAKRRLPTDPMAIAARRAAERRAEHDPGAWGVNRPSLALSANAEIEAWTETSGRRLCARRRDVFDRLLGGGRSEALAAVRRLQADLAARERGQGGIARYAERIDAGRTEDSGMDKRLRAGERLRRVLDLTGPASARLLLSVIEPPACVSGGWRAIVERETGERLADAQAGVLRGACFNLASAFAALDGIRR